MGILRTAFRDMVLSLTSVKTCYWQKNVGCSVGKTLGLEIRKAVAPDGSVKLLYIATRKSTVVKTSGI